jgi:hypothetical protein
MFALFLTSRSIPVGDWVNNSPFPSVKGYPRLVEPPGEPPLSILFEFSLLTTHSGQACERRNQQHQCCVHVILANGNEHPFPDSFRSHRCSDSLVWTKERPAEHPSDW